MLSRLPGELLRYPLDATSHDFPDKVTALPPRAAEVVALFVDLNLTAVAPLRVTRLSHVVLK